MKESVYQNRVIRRLRKTFPDCVILKNDSSYVQGIPDLLILFNDRWAMLEVKAERDSPQRPNQEHYISLLAQMSYAAFVYPEIEDRVFDELQYALSNRRSARVS